MVPRHAQLRRRPCSAPARPGQLLRRDAHASTRALTRSMHTRTAVALALLILPQAVSRGGHQRVPLTHSAPPSQWPSSLCPAGLQTPACPTHAQRTALAMGFLILPQQVARGGHQHVPVVLVPAVARAVLGLPFPSGQRPAGLHCREAGRSGRDLHNRFMRRVNKQAAEPTPVTCRHCKVPSKVPSKVQLSGKGIWWSVHIGRSTVHGRCTTSALANSGYPAQPCVLQRAACDTQQGEAGRPQHARAQALYRARQT